LEKNRLMPDFEIALPLGAIAFYLYDSVMLLHNSEVVFHKRLKSWDWSLGSSLFLFGKRLSAPGLLIPWSLVLRSRWDARPATAARGAPGTLATLESRLLPVRILCTLMLLLLLFGLPFTAIVRGIGPEMLAVFASFYLLVVASIVVLIARRAELGLDNKALLALSIDALACAPFAVNLVGKVSLRAISSLDPLHFSNTQCSAERNRELRTTLAARVDDLLEFGAPDERDSSALRDFAAQLRSGEG
jgi:hypothetical protein